MLTKHNLRSSSSLNKGFTLVEMMVTITILVISLGLAAPSLNESIKNHQLRSAAQSLKNSIRNAQSQAQSQSRIVAIIFTSQAIPESGILEEHLKDELKHWAIFSIPLEGSKDSESLLYKGFLHKNNKISLQIDNGDSICFNSLGRISRQDLKKPLTLECATSPTITITHSDTEKTATLNITSSGKTTLKY